MRLSSELRVSAPLQDTWAAVLDLPRVARALPGAALDPDPVDGGYRGKLEVELGPANAEYRGLARLVDCDEDERIASFYIVGREAHGQGSAEATIAIRLDGDAIATRLRFETEMQVAGRDSQLGAVLLDEVAAGLLREFAARLGRSIVPDELVDRAEPFDAGRAGLRPLVGRGAIALAGVLVGLALGRAIRRR